jgi:hypothetical protein
MDFTFADDAKQEKPTRPGMGPLVAVGGIHVPDAFVSQLERGLGDLAESYGFGPKDRFKWSPRKELWMAKGLVEEKRAQFFDDALKLASELDVRATVVVVDPRSNPANAGLQPEDDALSLFLERVEWRYGKAGTEGVVIIDRPSGGTVEDGKFIHACAEKLRDGTRYVQYQKIAMNVLSVSSDNSRSLQLADLVTSCTVAHIAGEDKYSPRAFARIRPLFCEESGRIGGVGLKIHPDLKYANLYHWVAGDEYMVRGNVGIPYPILGPAQLYTKGPLVP